MKVFTVLVHWKRQSAESGRYPRYDETTQANSTSSPVLQAWKEVVKEGVDIVFQQPGFLYYNRFENEFGDTISATYYVNEEAYNSLYSNRTEFMERLLQAREDLAKELKLTVVEKSMEMEVTDLDAQNFDRLLACLQESGPQEN